MILTRLVALILRVAELVFAAIVAGLTGEYLHKTSGVSAWDNGRFIYSVVVAGLSILLALIWLIPFTSSFFHYPADFFISIMWWVVFGLLVNFVGDACGYIFNWDNIAIRRDDQCGKWKAIIAFSFLSALCWLVSALLSVYVVHRERRNAAVATSHRRRWGRHSRV